MKNVQVIDGAMDCAYSIFQLTDEEFKAVFPAEGQDIEFLEDLGARFGEDAVRKLLAPAWDRELLKPDAVGIHGTLFYRLEYKKKFYPNKRDSHIADNHY